MKIRKSIIIICSIIIIAIATVIILINNIIKPKHTSKELFVKTNNDLIDFALNLSECLSDMSDIMKDDLDVIITDDNNVNMSKSTKFRNVKEKIEQDCNKIINYNNTGLSKEMNDYINYAKKVSKDILKYFNDINKELSQDEFTELLNKFSSEFARQSSKLTELNTKACLAYYNEISEDKKALEEFKEDAEKCREEAEPKQGADRNVSKSSQFTNKYGTVRTICAHKGCSDYIVTTGDSNCCEKHSRRCANCGTYIDEDAFYCMDCLEKAIKRIK